MWIRWSYIRERIGEPWSHGDGGALTTSENLKEWGSSWVVMVTSILIGKWWRDVICPQKAGVIEESKPFLSIWWKGHYALKQWTNIIKVSQGTWFVMCELANGDDIPFVREHHDVENKGCHYLHGIHEATSQKIIII